MSDEFAAWAAEVRQLCAATGIEAPQPHELEDMYEDGLDPADAAKPAIRMRYTRPARRPQGVTIADLTAEAVRRNRSQSEG
jgi:hypothetical protein